MQSQFLPAKLLLSFVNKCAGRTIIEASRQGGARGGTKLFARAWREDAACAFFPDYCTQEIVITLMWDEAESVIASILEGVANCPGHIDGTAVVIDVPNALARSFSAEAIFDTKGDTMKPDATMIVCITNHGEAEFLMQAARKVGARGGTIINARGTGTEDDLKYFGVSLTPEKEILIIICDTAHSERILKELGDQPLFSEPGGGIIFTTAVERFIPLKNLK